MVTRLAIALVLGGLLGIEREVVGKEAGVRTEMLVAGGSAIFTMIGLSLPYILTAQTGELATFITNNSGFISLIGNIVTGVGFLGAGLIIKTGNHAHGLTTAALVWATAAVGVLVGLGLNSFAVVSAVLMTGLLYILRKMNISERLEGHPITNND